MGHNPYYYFNYCHISNLIYTFSKVWETQGNLPLNLIETHIKDRFHRGKIDPNTSFHFLDKVVLFGITKSYLLVLSAPSQTSAQSVIENGITQNKNTWRQRKIHLLWFLFYFYFFHLETGDLFKIPILT